jgi:hypothetical protein
LLAGSGRGVCNRLYMYAVSAWGTGSVGSTMAGKARRMQPWSRITAQRRAFGVFVACNHSATAMHRYQAEQRGLGLHGDWPGEAGVAPSARGSAWRFPGLAPTALARRSPQVCQANWGGAYSSGEGGCSGFDVSPGATLLEPAWHLAMAFLEALSCLAPLSPPSL